MTSISALLAAGRTRSLEFFPPKSSEGEAHFRTALDDLVALGPSFASVTYGALGTTRERTRDIVVSMNADHDFPTMAHLACVGHTRGEIADLLDQYAAGGVRNILALGGDPPEHDTAEGDFRHALELVETVRAHPAGFCIGVAAHPEMHPRSADRAEDRRHLAAKLMAADFAITQFFFRAEDYERMVDELAALGVDRPVVPGVMPFTSVAGLRRMAAMNRTTIPNDLDAALDRVDGDADAVRELGIEVATELCQRLERAGAPGVHIYTLNRAASAQRVLDELTVG